MSLHGEKSASSTEMRIWRNNLNFYLLLGEGKKGRRESICKRSLKCLWQIEILRGLPLKLGWEQNEHQVSIQKVGVSET